MKLFTLITACVAIALTGNANAELFVKAHSASSVSQEDTVATVSEAPAVKQEAVVAPANASQEKQEWVINKGQPISEAIAAWAERAGWAVDWNVPENDDGDWAAPNITTFSGSFVDAASDAIRILAANGVAINATFHTANKTLVVDTDGAHDE